MGLFSLALAAHAAEEDDRRRQYQDAYKTLEEGNQQKLQPQKMMHDMNKMRLLQEAQQARQNKDEGTAQRKEREAMMEQMKSQQLQQQMDKNQQAANQNREREALVSKNEENSQGDQKKGYDAKVTSLRNGKVPEASEEDRLGPEESPSVPPPAQLANLSEVPQLPSPLPLDTGSPAPAAGPPSGEEPSTAGMLLSDLELLESRDRVSIGFNDGAKVNPGAGGAALTEGSAQYRLLTAAVGGTGGAGAGGEGGAGDTDIWGNPGSDKGENGEENSDGRARGVAGAAGAGGLAGALAGQNVLKGKNGKGALDGDFFAACPGPEELEKAEAEGKKVKMNARCRKFVARCESELEQAENPGRRRDPVEPSEDCRKWKEAEEERIAAAEEDEKEKKGSVSGKKKKGKAAPKKGPPGRRTAARAR